jgi:general secretion pathway protein J
MSRARQSGVTLPELLIALFIFALISGAAVYTLRLSIDGREQLARSDSTVRDLQVLRIILREDLLQMAPRTARDEFGNLPPAQFLGGAGFSFRTPVEGETPLLGFVRDGRANPEAVAPRSTLQPVEYILVGDRLVRRTRTYVDAARSAKIVDRVLMKGVRSVRPQFLNGETPSGLQWVELWPSLGAVGAPRAMRLELETEAFGALTLDFWIGGEGK